ncbi:carbohydrate ABC transporter permease [Jiangella asiatica]|uniref:Carbohydrate ABC transporter permease n=1 Tax=Jiangella asiatica TaxID=2530372 RepID=A0A4V2Z380_9ACTN|nr:carbohydrate ABC transporter permease [Jiangella asiatica]TDE11428.1 carbohydrate ABC transporter permease [Jiangella asiatica]
MTTTADVSVGARTGARARRAVAPARRRRRTLVVLGQLVGFAVLAMWCLFPMYWMIVSSLKGPSAILSNSLVPASPSLLNFETIFQGSHNLLYALRNSLIVAGTTTVIALIVGTLAAYAAARLPIKRRGLVMGIVLATSMFPHIAIVPPLFQLFTEWGWIDTYQALVLPYVSFGLPFAIWVLYSYFRQLPWELEQAAQVDGCTPLTAFARIVLPLAAPAVFTTAILVFIIAWNEFLMANTFSLTLASQPVTVAIARFTGGSELEQPFGPIMAAGVVVTIPLIIVVLIFQRKIIGGLTAGGLKG